MKAIRTKYLRGTNTRPAKIKADDYEGNSVIVSCGHYTSVADSHKAAVIALLKKMNWTGKMVGGATDTGFVYIFIDKKLKLERKG